MTTRRSGEVGLLLASVRQSPGDWQRWLVLADWLTESGDTRGPLVMLEHRLASEDLSDEARAALQRQIDALMEEHRTQWLEGLPGLPQPPGTRFEWQHGFVIGARLHWSSETLPFLAALRAHPTGSLLRTLRLHHSTTRDDRAAALAASPHLAGLTALELRFNGIGPEGAATLAASPHVRSLVALDLFSNALTDAGATALAASSNLRALTRLNLGANRLTGEGAAALAASPHLGALRELDLRHNAIGDEGAVTLAASETLRGCTVHT